MSYHVVREGEDFGYNAVLPKAGGWQGRFWGGVVTVCCCARPYKQQRQQIPIMRCHKMPIIINQYYLCCVPLRIH